MKVFIERESLVIRVGFDVLSMATENHPDLWNAEEDKPRLAVTDIKEFAKSVVIELTREEEDGTTLLHVAFDKAILNAVENGAEGITLDGE